MKKKFSFRSRACATRLAASIAAAPNQSRRRILLCVHWLSKMRAARPHVHRVQRLAGHHEQPVSARAAEADVGANLRQPDLADALAGGREDVDAVIPGSAASGAGPDIAVLIGADSIGHAVKAR